MAEFHFIQEEDKLVCVLKGRFGADVNEPFAVKLTEKIEDCLSSHADPGKLNVHFDMKQVDFIASAFIRTCMSTSRKVNPGNFRIVNASPMIKKTFLIAGLDKAFNVS